jgi:hypothetical protein
MDKVDENLSEKCIKTQRVIDGITYTTIARSSANAKQTLQAKLEAIIGREIARTAEKSLDL